MANPDLNLEEVPVLGEDLKLLLICTFRYALGRRTYMPSESVVLLKQYGKGLLRQQDWDQIVGDIREAERTERLGDECDKRMWLEFVKWIESQQLTYNP